MPATTQSLCLCYNCFSQLEKPEGPCPYCGFDLTENEKKYPVALRAGTMLNGRYIVGRVLGQGGFGITYLALDTKLNARVAIKEFMPGEIATRIGTTVSVMSEEKTMDFSYGEERFQEEAQTLAKFIGHPNIAGVSDCFDENDTSYFVMDYIEGISFKSYIANAGGKVSVDEALNVMIPVLRALTAVHAEGFIHRDVTPDNIYISKDGNVKLLDFGSARYSLGDKSKSLDVILKVGYAPKEQYIRRGRQGPYTDVYSCAACFYAALTGYLPPESLERLDQDTLVPVSQCGVDIPEWLDKAILKGLAVQPEDRFQSAEEFLSAIENQQVVELPPQPGQAPPAPAKSRIKPAMIGGIAAAAVLALAIGVGVLGGGGPSGSGETGGANAVAEVLAPKVTIGTEEYSTALTKLDLSEQGLTDSDIQNLREMTHLVELDLRGNDLTDLSPLSGLTDLEQLRLSGDISGNEVLQNLTPLSGLTNLRTLHIPASSITDLSPIAGLTKMEDLALNGGSGDISSVSDFSALANMTELKELYLFADGISDLSFLTNLTKLESLRISCGSSASAQYTDLSPLRNLTNLRQLELYASSAEAPLDITPLAGMTQLQSLRMGNNIADLTPLSGLTKLKTLNLGDQMGSVDHQFQSLEPLRGLTNLTDITIRNQHITDISPLSALSNLRSAKLYMSRVTDWSPVDHVPNVTKN